MSFTTFNGFNFGKVQTQNVSGGGGGIGGWVELGRYTATGSESAMTVSSIPDKRYYQVLYYDKGMGGADARLLKFNNDTGSNYARRYSDVGGADTTATSQANHNGWGNNDVTPQFAVMYHANYSTKEKLSIIHQIGQTNTGAGNAPRRIEFTGKWANTSNAINRIDVTSAGTFNSGDEMIILGYDPSDTHTTNFWEELHSGDSGGVVASYNTGTFTAKKYLWIQMMVKNTTEENLGFQFNSDSGNNYAFRLGVGALEESVTSTSKIQFNYGAPTTYNFINVFIVNNSVNEKLCIIHTVAQNTAGAGNAPYRSEWVGKWTNTSSQITSVQLIPSASTLTLLKMKIWGSN